MPSSHLDHFTRIARREGPAEWLPLDMSATAPFLDVVEARKGTRNLVQAFDLGFEPFGGRHPDDSRLWREANAELGVELPADAQIGFGGTTHLVPPRESLGSAYHLLEMAHPMAAASTVGELESLPWPDMADPAYSAHFAQEVERIHASGRVAVGCQSCAVFEAAWYVRGMDNLFMDLADGNGLGDWLLDWYLDASLEVARRVSEAGADVMVIGDDVGTQRGMMMAPEFWRRHLKPRLRKLVDAVHGEGGHRTLCYYHSDGDIRDIVGDLVEVGIDFLNPVQPECMSLDALASQYGRQIGFWGMIGTQTTMPFGSPDEVRAAVANCREWLRRGVPIVVAPTHVLEPDVPWENAVALVEAARMPV